jgi:hypothetical protein
MHAITPDGKTLLLADAFGLTRLTFPNKLKTDRKAMTSEEGVLSLDAAGAHALVWDDRWSQLHRFALPALTRAGSFARFAHEGAHLTPDGERLIRFTNNRIELHSVATKKTTTVAFARDPAGSPSFAFGREGVTRALTQSALAVGADGTIALLVGDNKLPHLLVGVIDAHDQFVKYGEFALTIGGGGPLRFTARDGGVTLRLVEPGIKTVYVLRIARDGARRAFTLPGLTLPEHDGDAWVTQVSESEVVRCDDKGEVKARWALRDPAHHGVGELIAHAGRAWIVPPHRGCLVELATGAVISRKLSEKEAPVRRYDTPIFARYNRAAAPFGRVFSLGRTAFWNHGTQVSGTFTMSSGDASLGANVLYSALFNELGDGDASALAPYTRGGTGAGNFSTALLVPVTEAEVARLFKACDEQSVWLPFGLDWLFELYSRRLTGQSRVWGEAEGPPGDIAAERALLRGVLAHLGDMSVPALSPHLAEWRGELHADEVCAALARVNDEAPQLPARAFAGVAWMLARVLDAPEAARAIEWMLVDGSERQFTNSEHEMKRALAHVLKANPELKEGAVEWAQAHAPAPRRWGSDRRDALLAHLASV